jgi:TonB family protein
MTENLLWNPQIVGLSSEVIDIAKGKSIGKFMERFQSPITTYDEPVLVKDEKSEVTLVVFPFSKGRYVVKIPTCDSCPSPVYSVEMLRTKYEGAVRLRATITEKGMADQIRVIGTPNPVFAESAIATAQGWHFNPATGVDGKPLSVRMPVDVTFRVPH